MATQTDVQQLIQGLTPSSNQSGNPNTAYNNSPGGTGGAAIPMTDAHGNWFTPTISQAANYTPSVLDLPASSPIRFPTLPMLPSGGGSGTGGGVTPSTPVQPTVPMTPGAPGGGGFGGPSSGVTGGGMGTGPTTGGGVNTQWYSGPPVNPMGPTGGSNWTNTWGTEAPDASGNYDWNKLIEIAGKVVTGTPGDFYLDGSQSWDVSNMITGVLQKMTGLPVNYLTTKLGEYGAEHGWSENNPFVNHYMDNVQNNLDLHQQAINQANNERFQNYLSSFTQYLQNGVFDNNVATAATKSNTNMDAAMQAIQDAINAGKSPTGGSGGSMGGIGSGISTVGPINVPRPIGGTLNFTGGAGGYNNGVGAGTGFGASNYMNDEWGTVASGFGVGAGAGGSSGMYALQDALTAAKKNKV